MSSSLTLLFSPKLHLVWLFPFTIPEACCKVDNYLSNLVVVFSAPSEAPHLVTAYNSSSTSFVVRWSHLPEKHFQGKPIGYRIRCYSNDSENDKKVVRLNYTTNTTTLTNLAIYTMYFIEVSAVSSGGIGLAKKVKARTDAAGAAFSSK